MTCVDWPFANRNIAPRRRSSPRGLYFSRGCASGLFRSLDRNTSFFLPSSDHPGGLKACLALKYESPQIKKRKRLGDVPSFGLSTAGGAGRLVGDVCGNYHEFGLAIVLGKLDFLLARGELTAPVIAFSPCLVEEVVLAQAMEHKLGCSCRSIVSAGVGKSHALCGLLRRANLNDAAVVGHGFDGVLPSRVGVVADDKVEGDASLYVGRLSLSSRSQQQDSQSEKDRA